jgi:hypothetical protein
MKWYKDSDYQYGASMLVLIVTLITVLFIYTKEAQASTRDFELVVMDRGDPRTPLAIKRFISVSDCRSEREWLLSLLARTNSNPVWIVCAREGS